jgi:hypothetical protein
VAEIVHKFRASREREGLAGGFRVAAGVLPDKAGVQRGRRQFFSDAEAI